MIRNGHAGFERGAPEKGLTRGTSPVSYLTADNKLKQEAIERTAPIGTPPGRYQPPDQLLGFLESL